MSEVVPCTSLYKHALWNMLKLWGSYFRGENEVDDGCYRNAVMKVCGAHVVRGDQQSI